MTYSANEELKKLAQNMGFEIFLFDDPTNLSSKIKVNETSKNREIDAVMQYKNLICLVEIDKGERDNIVKKIKEFFEKLDRVNKPEQINLAVKVTSRHSNDLTQKVEEVNGQIKTIKDRLDTYSTEYKCVLKKIFFAPNKQLDEEFMSVERKKGGIIIDKDTYEYFKAVLDRLDKKSLFNDFMYFLGVRKADLEKKKQTSRTGEPAQSQPYRTERLEIDRDRVIMYSLSATVEDIRNYVTTLRIAQKYNKKGFQRMVKANRLNKINSEYLAHNYTFPNNIIVALDPNIYKTEKNFYNSGEKKLRFFDEYNSLIIIDGQHRFFSFIKGNKVERPILINLLFFKKYKEDSYLMEKMFYEINKKQERIDPNLSFMLKARIEPESSENFWYSVLKQLDKAGFFRGKFSFKETTMRYEVKKSIISVVTYGGLLTLNKEYKKQGLLVNGLNSFYNDKKEDKIKFACLLINNYFGLIEEILNEQRIQKDNLTAREIGALLRLIRQFILSNSSELKRFGEVKDILKSNDPDNKAAVTIIRGILENVKFNDVVALSYPPSNWAAVEGFILKKIHQKMKTFGNTAILSKKGKEVYDKS